MDENEERVMEFRREKDEFYRTGADSPLSQEQKASFKGLRYFPYDPGFAVTARYVPYDNPEEVPMNTSKGIREVFIRVGYFEFMLLGKKLKLQAYRSPHGQHSESLFVPFTDETSGKESYAKARYLDISEEDQVNAGEGSGGKGVQYRLDFNLAYNPYCAYTDRYICPYPPEENRLDVPVRAGEMKYVL